MEALKISKAVEESIAKDQGNKYRYWLKKVLPHIEDAYRTNKSPFRNHLGASLIGRNCPRQLWYSFRWYKQPLYDARMIRLFNRGHLEEARFIAALLSAGVMVYQQDKDGKQYRFSDHKGHFCGSCDGIAVDIPDAPKDPCLLEFKTHNSKSFKKVSSEGVRNSKFEHYVQMQIYMKQMGLYHALYCAVDKDTDEFYFELVEYDPETAEQYTDRAQKIIFLDKPPQRISNTPGWLDCKFCDYNKICFFEEKHFECCRNCKKSEPVENGQWKCRLKNLNLKSTEEKCEFYEPIEA